MNAIVKFRLCTLTDEELLKKVDSLTDEMYTTMKVPVMQVPARPNEDYDLLVGELIKRFNKRLTNKEETTPLSAEEVLGKYVGKSYLRMWSEWQKEVVIKAMIIFAAQPLPDFVKSKEIKWIREDFVIDTIMMEWVKKLVNDGRLLIVAGSEEYFATRGIENPPNAAASQPSPQVEDRMKWVKASERLPQKEGHYFAKTEEGRCYIMIVLANLKIYHSYNTPFQWLEEPLSTLTSIK